MGPLATLTLWMFESTAEDPGQRPDHRADEHADCARTRMTSRPPLEHLQGGLNGRLDHEPGPDVLKRPRTVEGAIPSHSAAIFMLPVAA